MSKNTKVKCINGHHFLLDKYSNCPLCGGAPIDQPTDKDDSGADSEKKNPVKNPDLTTGWLVCTKGVYHGEIFSCKTGRNKIGGNVSCDINLAKDQSIKAEPQAYIIYDPKKCTFYLQGTDDTDLVYHNGDVLFVPTQLCSYDRIEIGNTELLFVPLCGAQFSWGDTMDDGDQIVFCDNGHAYDRTKFRSCPKCSDLKTVIKVRCPKGHYFDCNRYRVCPECNTIPIWNTTKTGLHTFSAKENIDYRELMLALPADAYAQSQEDSVEPDDFDKDCGTEQNGTPESVDSCADNDEC